MFLRRKTCLLLLTLLKERKKKKQQSISIRSNKKELKIQKKEAKRNIIFLLSFMPRRTAKSEVKKSDNLMFGWRGRSPQHS